MEQKRKMRLFAVVAVFGLLAMVQVAPAVAAPQSWPNGPWEVPQQ